MSRVEMRFNGRKITSSAQLEREMKRSVEKHLDDSLRKTAGPGVRIKKIDEGYVFHGSSNQIDRLAKRLR